MSKTTDVRRAAAVSCQEVSNPTFPPQVETEPQLAKRSDLEGVASIASFLADTYPKLVAELVSAEAGLDRLSAKLTAERTEAEDAEKPWRISDEDREDHDSYKDQLKYIRSNLSDDARLMNVVMTYAKYFLVYELKSCPIIQSSAWRNHGRTDWGEFENECFLVERLLLEKSRTLASGDPPNGETNTEPAKPGELETVAGGEGGDDGKLPHIRPCAAKALSQYVSALDQEPTLKTDRHAYDWLTDKNANEGDCSLPTFATWARYLRSARAVTHTQKNSTRICNESRSVVPVKRI